MHILKYSAITIAALVVPAALVASVVVAFGASSRKPAITKTMTVKAGAAKVSPVVFARNSGSVRSLSAMPLDPQSLAKDRAAFAPAEAFRKEAEADYHSGDLAGAEAACFQAFSAAPVLHGQKQQMPYVDLLLGRIYLKGGQYAKALPRLQRAQLHPITSGIDLDLALAYVRLGDYKNASRFYSDQAIMQYHSESNNVLLQDLPGTDSPRALEASILLARGQEVCTHHRDDEALADFQEAARLAPDNALIAYDCAYILSEEGRHSEATLLFQRAASTGRGTIAREAKHRAANEMPRKALTWAPLQVRRPTTGASKQ